MSSSDESSVTLDTKLLDQLTAALSGDIPMVRVGILADSTHNGSETTNVEIGTAHEFGAPARKLPERSFLRMPLNTKLHEYMEEAGLFEPKVIAELAKNKTFKPYMNLVGEIALNVIRDAFDTGGFGKWRKWKDKNYTNNSGMLLVDTHQLRDSIAYEVT